MKTWYVYVTSISLKVTGIQKKILPSGIGEIPLGGINKKLNTAKMDLNLPTATTQNKA